MSVTERQYGCENCQYFAGVRWLGAAKYVICPKLPGGKSRDIRTYRGCGDFLPAGDAAGRQATLF